MKIRDSSFNCGCILEISWAIRKSMNDGLFGISKQVSSLLRLLRLLTTEKSSFKQLSFNSELRSTKITVHRKTMVRKLDV